MFKKSYIVATVLAIISLVGCKAAIEVEKPVDESAKKSNDEKKGDEKNEPDTSIIEYGSEGTAVRIKYRATVVPATFKCRFSLLDEKLVETEFIDCPSDEIVQEIVPGLRYRFQVKASNADLVTDSSPAELIFVSSELPQWPTKVENAISNHLQIGDFYEFSVKPGFHVTEYSTSKTTGVLSFYRIMNESDPHYLMNHKCEQAWDKVVKSSNPSEDAVYSYCHSTPRREQYKGNDEYRLANNHIEVATDATEVKQGNHERLSMSVYDTDWEFMVSRSRFKNLCRNSEINARRVPFIPDFFRGHQPEEVSFFYCDAIVPSKDGAPTLWKIGAFVAVDDPDWSGVRELDWSCHDCSYLKVVEVVYMAQPDSMTWRDDQFARKAQSRILDFVTKLKP